MLAPRFRGIGIRRITAHSSARYESKAVTRLQHRQLHRPATTSASSSSKVASTASDDEIRRHNTTVATTDSASLLQRPGDDLQKRIQPKCIYRYLRLQSYSKAELYSVFDEIQKHGKEDEAKDEKTESTASDMTIPSIDDAGDSSNISRIQLSKFLEDRMLELEQENRMEPAHDQVTTAMLRQRYALAEASRIFDFLNEKLERGDHGSMISKDDFADTLHDTASAIDYARMYPISLSMVLVGSSVGIVTPAMPFIVQELGLTAGQYGLSVSAFALAKMAGNIPSAVLVERHGRKPYLVYTLSAIAIGVGGIGLVSSFEQLYLCRLLTGLGVAGLSAAATMAVTDMSTPLNRASTFAPIMSAFAAGTALGPALGGVLCDTIGIHPTFYLVGVSYIGVAAINRVLIQETKPRPMEFPWQKLPDDAEGREDTIQQSFRKALGQWKPLLAKRSIRNVCIMNNFYWIALAGSQMTLLPLILTDPDGLAMSATNVGQVYAGMSIVQVMGNPVLAKIVDRVGKAQGMVGGCSLIAVAMASLPLCSDLTQMAGVLGIWATGSTLLSTAPVAYVSDQVKDDERAQALALLRTSGDVGFLIGSTTMGMLADWSGSLDIAMQSSAGILLTATGWFATRQLLSSQIQDQTTEKKSR